MAKHSKNGKKKTNSSKILLEKFNYLLNYSSEGVLILEIPSSKIILANEKAYVNLEIEQKLLLTKCFKDFLLASDWDKLASFFEKKILADQEHLEENMDLTLLGKKDVSIRLTLGLENINKEFYAVAILHFYTKRIPEEKFKFDRDLLNSILDGLNEVLYVVDPDTYEILYMNEIAENSWGDWRGKKCFNLLQNLEQPCDFCSNDKILGKNIGHTYIWEWQNLVNKRWYRCFDKAIKWPDGRYVRFELAIDITKEKGIEKELHENQNQYRTLLENIPQKIFLKDKNLTYIFCNEKFAQDLGLTPDEIAGKNDYNFFPKELADKYRADDKRILETGKTEEIEESSIQNGVAKILHIKKTPVIDKNGNIIGIFGIL